MFKSTVQHELKNTNWHFTTLCRISDAFPCGLECLTSTEVIITFTWKLMGKQSVSLNPGLTIFGGGVWVISLLSGFISGHNFFTLLSGGGGGVATFRGSLLSKLYGLIKLRSSFAIYWLYFQSCLFSLQLNRQIRRFIFWVIYFCSLVGFRDESDGKRGEEVFKWCRVSWKRKRQQRWFRTGSIASRTVWKIQR